MDDLKNIEETVSIPLNKRDAIIVGRRINNFINFICYPEKYPHKVEVLQKELIEALTSYLLVSGDSKLFEMTFGCYDYNRLDEVGTILSKRVRHIDSYWRGSEEEWMIAICDFIGRVFYEKKILEDGGYKFGLHKNNGRKKSNFKEFFTTSYVSKSDEIINLLKTQMGNRSGKKAAIVLIAAIKNRYIITPEKNATDRVFGRELIITRDYYKYLSKNQSPDLWSSKEVEEMQSKLKI